MYSIFILIVADSYLLSNKAIRSFTSKKCLSLNPHEELNENAQSRLLTVSLKPTIYTVLLFWSLHTPPWKQTAPFGFAVCLWSQWAQFTASKAFAFSSEGWGDSFLSISGRVPAHILPTRVSFSKLLDSCLSLAGTGALILHTFPDCCLCPCTAWCARERFWFWFITVYSIFKCHNDHKFGIDLPFRAKRGNQWII